MERKINIEIVPDGTFHTYRINAKTVLRNRLYHGDPLETSIKKVFLSPSNVSNDEVEIDYIRFISKWEKYSKEPYGKAYETMAKELRKVLYANTPLCLRYTWIFRKKKLS